MKTPDEIKKGLEICIGACRGDKTACPYRVDFDGCLDIMHSDALAYIQQLEAGIAEWEYVAASPGAVEDMAREIDRLEMQKRQTAKRIQQLEAKVPKWMNDEGSILCPYCGGTIRMIQAWQKSMPDMGGYMWSARGKCSACGSITPETHGRTAKEANEAAYAAAQWGHVPLPEPPEV